MSKEKFKATDRYGGAYPNPETVCKGQCEGMGVVPISKDDMEEPWRTLWLEAEKKKPSDDGTHFVKCPECNGTGNRVA